MNRVDYLIIGGSAAGTTAAEVIRGLKPDATITIITDENHEQYSRVLLPYYIRHQVSREQVILKKQEWYQQREITFVKKTRATRLDAQNHVVSCDNGDQYKYGKLLITVGGKVVKLEAPGADLANILYFRTIEDADQIVEVARTGKKALVVGGGFVSLDFATGFRANGVEKVTILVREPYYWFGKLDEDSSRIMKSVLEENGVEILTQEEVVSFEPIKGAVGAVKTKSGKRYECDVVGVGIGIISDLGWLSGSGIKINQAIETNEYLETSLPDVYAAGDCAQFYDVIFRRAHIVGNWANATSQGSAVGKTICGQRTLFETASSYSDSFFGKSYSFIGVTDEKFADEVVNRGSVADGWMTRIFVKTIDSEVRVVGATVINNPAEVSPLTSAVKDRVDIGQHKNRLADLDFDLKNLLV